MNFSFINTNPDQAFDVVDVFNNGKIWQGNLNHLDQSPVLACWEDGNGHGRVRIVGSVSGITEFDVLNDGTLLNY